MGVQNVAAVEQPFNSASSSIFSCSSQLRNQIPSPSDALYKKISHSVNINGNLQCRFSAT
jgi:hypothetical protein